MNVQEVEPAVSDLPLEDIRARPGQLRPDVRDPLTGDRLCGEELSYCEGGCQRRPGHRLPHRSEPDEPTATEARFRHLLTSADRVKAVVLDEEMRASAARINAVRVTVLNPSLARY